MRIAKIIAISTIGFAAVACSHAADAQQNELVDIEATSEWSTCQERTPPRAIRACWNELVGEHEWEVMIYHAASITGDNSTIVPNAIQLLEEMVEECNLGRAVLTYATDGVAFLSIGNPDLNEDQLDCVQGYERPGLWLQESKI